VRCTNSVAGRRAARWPVEATEVVWGELVFTARQPCTTGCTCMGSRFGLKRQASTSGEDVGSSGLRHRISLTLGDRGAAPLGAAGKVSGIRRPLRRRPVAAVRLPRSRSGERDCRNSRGIRSVNVASVVKSPNGAGRGKKSRASSVVPLPRRAGPRSSPPRVPGSPPKCPISRVPPAVPRTAYSTITKFKAAVRARRAFRRGRS
jgi:hypothetical protein